MYLHAVMSHHYFRGLFNESIAIVPREMLKASISDVHIVVNYQTGDTFEGVKCQHTNRLYLQNDKDNMEFPGLD